MNNILEKLNKDQLKLFKRVDVKKEKVLFNEGELCSLIGFVVEGEIEIVSYTRTGQEIVYNHLTPGMMFGNNLVFSSNPVYKGNVIAVQPSIILLIEKGDLMQILQQNSDFLLEFLKYQSDMGKQLNSQIKLISIDSAEERFFYYADINKGTIHYSSITKLAEILHLQRETLSRLISRLIKENRIIKVNKTIKIVNE